MFGKPKKISLNTESNLNNKKLNSDELALIVGGRSKKNKDVFKRLIEGLKYWNAYSSIFKEDSNLSLKNLRFLEFSYFAVLVIIRLVFNFISKTSSATKLALNDVFFIVCIIIAVCEFLTLLQIHKTKNKLRKKDR